MFKSRSPFFPPTLPGQSYMTSKIDEEPRYRSQKRNMSIQEPKQDIKGVKPTLHSSVNNVATSNPISDERFCFEIQKPYDENGQTETDLYWWYQLTNQVSSEHQRKLIFREQQYFVRADQANIYQTIYIAIDGIQGYKNRTGVITNNVCALHLAAISSVVDDTGTTLYDLLYKQTQDCAWDIPMSLGEIKLRIYCDADKRSGNLGVPMICQFDIRHIAR